MKVAITTAEPVYAYQREAIEEAFQCRVCETYGMVEIVAAASECPHGSMHLWPEVGKIEVFEDGVPMPNRQPGALVCTGLMNADMPLIRYKMGDRGALAMDRTDCECGRALPLMESIEGRTDDVLYTPDGRRVGRLSPVFKCLPIREAQTSQERLDLVRVRYVPTADFDASAGQTITERLQARMGNINVILEPVEKVPRGMNGKFRTVVCNLPPEERLRLENIGREMSALDQGATVQ
jgi:phenylacetate-CoA ligase